MTTDRTTRQTSSGAAAPEPLTLDVNGQTHRIAAPGNRTLLDVLRTALGLTGPKYGCGMAQCGACTVLIDGAPARACVVRAVKAAGHRIVTIEGLADPQTGGLHPVQQAFLDCQGAQCGYCLNGMVMTTVALLDRDASPSRATIRDALRHNLCRCGSHREIMASVERAAQLRRLAEP